MRGSSIATQTYTVTLPRRPVTYLNMYMYLRHSRVDLLTPIRYSKHHALHRNLRKCHTFLSPAPKNRWSKRMLLPRELRRQVVWKRGVESVWVSRVAQADTGSAGPACSADDAVTWHGGRERRRGCDGAGGRLEAAGNGSSADDSESSASEGEVEVLEDKTVGQNHVTPVKNAAAFSDGRREAKGDVAGRQRAEEEGHGRWAGDGRAVYGRDYGGGDQCVQHPQVRQDQVQAADKVPEDVLAVLPHRRGEEEEGQGAAAGGQVAGPRGHGRGRAAGGWPAHRGLQRTNPKFRLSPHQLYTNKEDEDAVAGAEAAAHKKKKKK